MKIVPWMKIKPLSDCEPCELIRCRWGSNYRWAICGTSENSRRALIALPDGLAAWPEFGFSQSTQVLSYGTDYVLRVDQTSAVEIPANHLSEVAGCLLVDEARWLLRVAAPSGFGHSPRWLDMTEGRFIHSPELNKCAAFGGWELHLRTHAAPAEQTERIAWFKWEAKASR